MAKDLIDNTQIYSRLTDFYARLVAEHSRDSIMVMDADGIVQWVNAGCLRVSGYTREQMVGRRPDDIFGTLETSIRADELFRRTIETRRTVTVQFHNRRPDGSEYWLETSASPVFGEHGAITHIVTVARDITKRRELELRTQAMIEEERTRRAERQLLAKMSEWLYAVKSYDELLEVIGASMRGLFPGGSGQLFVYSASRDALERVQQWGPRSSDSHVDPDDCWALRRGRAYSFGNAPIQLACTHVGEIEAPYFCLPIIAHGNTIGLLHVIHDDVRLDAADLDAMIEPRRQLALLCAEQISLAIANVRLRQELQDKSVRDPLTGLWNRRWFLDAAERALGRAARNDAPVALISLDVDRFKRFNDNHGHAAGDAVLREVGRLMAEVAEGAGASSCRLGGEEFMILCPDMDEAAAADLAQRLRAELDECPLWAGGERLPRVTVSAGVAQLGPETSDVPAIMKAADVALYAAKAGGRDRVVLASEITTEG